MVPRGWCAITERRSVFNCFLPTTFILSILVGICDPLCIQKCPDLLFCNAHRYFLRNNLLDSRTFNNFVPQHVRIQLIIASYALKQLGFQNLFIVVVVVVVVVVVCIVFVLFVNTKIIVVVVVLICLAFVTGRKVPNIRQMINHDQPTAWFHAIGLHQRRQHAVFHFIVLGHGCRFG